MTPGTADGTRLLDVTRLVRRVRRGHPASGIDRVGQAYVARYAHEARALVRIGPLWSVLTPADSRTLFAALEAWQPVSARFLWGAHTRAAWARVRLCARKESSTALLNVVHSGTESRVYRRRVRARGWRGVYFLHDLIPLSHPEHCRAGEARRHRTRVTTMLRSGELIITNSHDTRHQLLAFATLNEERVPPLVTAPLGLTRLPAAGPRPQVRPYCVVVATIESRKNHALLLDVWSAWAAEADAKVPTLVVIGRRGWRAEAVLTRLDHCPRLKPHLRVVHDADDAQLATYLAHAEALLFPSLAEGYGLPLAEALSMNVPVLASDLAVFREVAGDVPEYLAPTDAAAWRVAIEACCTDETVRRAQAQRRLHWRGATWEAHFAHVDRALAGVTEAATHADAGAWCHAS